MRVWDFSKPKTEVLVQEMWSDPEFHGHMMGANYIVFQDENTLLSQLGERALSHKIWNLETGTYEQSKFGQVLEIEQ